MNSQLEHLHQLVLMSVSTLFIFQSIILFVRGKDNRVRQTMAVIELLLGVGYVGVLSILSLVQLPDEFTLMRAKLLVVGSFYIGLIVLFPVQVFLPGWLTWKRGLMLFAPIILMLLLFYGGTYALGETPEDMISYAQVRSSIGHFNVWFRFVLLFVDFVYMVVLLRWIYAHEQKYIQWKNENFADQEYVDVSWMRQYAYILAGIYAFCLLNFFIGGRVIVMFHCSFAALGFSYLFYKTLFYESPYPADFFADKRLMHVLLAESEENLEELDEAAEDSFQTRIPGYVERCKRWFETDKPYLFNDFKLMDVARVLPLNRSYLSRMFNDGFGMNFSEVVRDYRVEYSITLLHKNMRMPISEVASLSGFRSEITYVRSFKQVKGITPAQYRAQHERKS